MGVRLFLIEQPMKFTIGDPVYVKSNREEGVITAFVSGEMAEVSVNGKRYVVYLTDLEHPYLNWFLNKKKEPKSIRGDQVIPEKQGARKTGLAMGLHLVFFPEYRLEGMEDVVDRIRVYLYNETWQDIQVDYHCGVKGETIFSLGPRLIPDSDIYLHDLSFESASQNPVFTVSCTDKESPAKHETYTFTLKGKKLHEHLHHLRFANLASFNYCLTQEIKVPPAKVVVKAPLHVQKQGHKKIDSHFDFEKAQKTALQAVDLHAEALGLDERRLKAGEILQLQLREAQKAIDLAMATHQHELILIHGVGKGTLKQELHRMLDQTKGGVGYVFDYDSRYGYGATRVIFTY